MPSSTSNSELDFDVNCREIRHGFASWLTALIGVAVMFVAGEVIVRSVIIPRADDIGRYRRFSDDIDALLAKPGSHVVFLGNSVTGECIDPREFQDKCTSDLKQPVSAITVAANGSGIATWYYMVKHYLATPNKQPDLLVFNHFQNGMLVREERVEIGRLAREFTSISDWPEVFSRETPGLGPKIDFALCYASSLYAYRSRIGLNVLGALSPTVPVVTANVRENAVRHDEFVQKKMTAKEPNNQTKTDDAAATMADTFEVTRLAKLCQQLRCKTVFIAYPQDAEHPNGRYTPNADALEILREHGMITLDLRHASEISTRHYKRVPFHDWTHMNEDGRKAYSILLATKLEPFIAEEKHVTSPLKPE